ncbi:MAG: DUF2726 domain-containing protein [Pseudomonadota bacterium]
MSFWILIIVCAVIAMVFIGIAKAKKGLGGASWPFYSKKPLSSPELILYFRLCNALPDHIVLAQVGLSRILGVKKGNNFGEWFNRINRMSADFVLCSKDSTVVAVIELDDASHKKSDRQAADAKKDKALGSAGIRIVRWQAKFIPDEAAIKATFANVLQVAPANRTASAKLSG